jgi:ribosomal protein S18 acetylase RimI-like enzyme
MIPTSTAQPARLISGIPPGCQLRLLQADALADYKRLRDASLSRHEEAFSSDAVTELRRPVESYASRLSQGRDGLMLFTLVAFLDGAMVGAVSCEREPRMKVRHIAHIIGMMVLDEVQGRGIGRALLRQSLSLLGADPELELVTLSVTRGNRAAVHLYESCGFSRYGRLPRALRLSDGSMLDKDLMMLSLRERP